MSYDLIFNNISVSVRNWTHAHTSTAASKKREVEEGGRGEVLSLAWDEEQRTRLAIISTFINLK